MKYARARIGVLLLATVLAAVTVGCGSSDDGGDVTGASDSGSPVKVIYMVPTLEDESYAREIAAAKIEAERLPNVEAEFVSGAGRFGASEMIAKIQNAVTTGVGAIIVNCGATCEQLQPVLSTAIGRGVKVIVVGQPIPNLEGHTTVVKLNFFDGAVPAGEYMVRALDGSGEIAIIRCVVGHPASDPREAGFRKGLEGSDVEVAVRGDAQCDPAKARAIMANFLTAHPDLDGVFSDTDVALAGVLKAVEASGRDLEIVGHDGQMPILRAIERGTVGATVQFPNEEVAVLAMRAAVDAARGKDVPPITDVPVRPLITKENAAEVMARIQAHKP